jgi:predicted RNA-binding protein (virulence factor B family)
VVATTLAPKAVLDEFACLQAKDISPFGAFMDWGLEKDLLVPIGEQQDRMKAGERYVIKVCLDKATDRLYGTSRIASVCEESPEDLSEGQKVDLLISNITPIGIMAVVNNRYLGMLRRSETYTPVSIGEKREGYVGRIREDGKIDLSLKKPGYLSISDSGTIVLDALEKSDGFIPCHDKSAPDKIRDTFSMSKKEFKRAIGRLYKEGRIEITDRGIRIKPIPLNLNK